MSSLRCSDSIEEQNSKTEKRKTLEDSICTISRDTTFLFSPFYWHLNELQSSSNSVSPIWVRGETWTFSNNENDTLQYLKLETEELWTSTHGWIGFARHLSSPIQLKTEKEKLNLNDKIKANTPRVPQHVLHGTVPPTVPAVHLGRTASSTFLVTLPPSSPSRSSSSAPALDST